MKPIFTVHAGEYLVADWIEQSYRTLRVWLPTKDTGVDLLVTNPQSRRMLSFQVKFSKDFIDTHVDSALSTGVTAFGWWKFNATKLKESPADYWVMVLYSVHARSIQQIVIEPKTLYDRLRKIHGSTDTFQTYLWTTPSERCWETRNLKKPQQREIAEGRFESRDRDFSIFLNNWQCLEKLKGAA